MDETRKRLIVAGLSAGAIYVLTAYIRHLNRMRRYRFWQKLNEEKR